MKIIWQQNYLNVNKFSKSKKTEFDFPPKIPVKFKSVNYIKTSQSTFKETHIMKYQEIDDCPTYTIENSSKHQTKIQKSKLQVFTQQKFLELSNHSLFSLMTMNISQLHQFQNGLVQYYVNEKILCSMISMLRYTKQTTKDQDQYNLCMKFEKEKKEIRIHTQKIIDKLIQYPLSQSILRDLSLRKLIRLRIGLRSYQQKEFYLINLVQRHIQRKLEQKNGVQQSNKKFQSKQKEEMYYKIWKFIYEPLSIIDLSYLQLVKLRDYLQRQSKQVFLLAVVKRMIKNQYSNGKAQLPNLKQQDLLKIQTQQDILLTMTYDFNIGKKSLTWLKNFKSNLEKYFEKEVILIQIIKRKIYMVERGIHELEEKYFQSKQMITELKQQEKGLNSLVFSIKKSLFGLYEAIKFNKQGDLNKKQKKEKIQEHSQYLLSDEDEDDSKEQ